MANAPSKILNPGERGQRLGAIHQQGCLDVGAFGRVVSNGRERRMYDVMSVWDTMDTGPDQSQSLRDYAEIWLHSDKVVYSTTMETVSTRRTKLERTFDPGAVETMKASAKRDLSIGGPNLARSAFMAGLVDECVLCVKPVLIGGGTRCLPDGLRQDLTLLDERHFEDGTVYLRYQCGRRRA